MCSDGERTIQPTPNQSNWSTYWIQRNYFQPIRENLRKIQTSKVYVQYHKLDGLKSSIRILNHHLKFYQLGIKTKIVNQEKIKTAFRSENLYNLY